MITGKLVIINFYDGDPYQWSQINGMVLYDRELRHEIVKNRNIKNRKTTYGNIMTCNLNVISDVA